MRAKGIERVFSYFDLFAFDHSFEVHFHFVVLQPGEPEHDAPALNRLDDLLRVIAAQNEPGGVTVVADDHSQSMLRPFSQTVSLVQNDKLDSLYEYFLLYDIVFKLFKCC